MYITRIFAMFVDMSCDDKNSAHAIAAFSRRYREKARRIPKSPDRKLFANESKITFLGHASTKGYGEHKIGPEEFASLLIKNGIQDGTTIDLLGCEIGFFSANKKSYAQIVYEELQRQGKQNISVNAFNN